MNEVFLPILEMAVLLPTVLALFLPVQDWLRVDKKKFFLILFPSLAVYCLLGGLFCYSFKLPTNLLTIPELILGIFFYLRLLTLSPWKAVSVLLAVCAVFSCLNALAVGIDAYTGAVSPLYLNPKAGIAHNLLGLAVTAIFWHPSTRQARRLLLEDEMVRTWYVFWPLPSAFICLNLFLTAQDLSRLSSGWIATIYFVITSSLLGLLLLSYLLFYHIAGNYAATIRLQNENHLLHMSQSRYESLQDAIIETRQARHDLRHHFHALSALAAKEDWESLRSYLSEAERRLPETELVLCANPTVDGTAGYYAAQYEQQGIAWNFRLELPERLPVPETDFCVVLSNLLENALEAGRRPEISSSEISGPDSRPPSVSVSARTHGETILLLTVENTLLRPVREQGGTFFSSKREGPGIGLSSVRRIAEKNGGYCRFEQDETCFRAHVMFRAGL
ncbi:MAG: GHKL domain-containing protein [Lachnospiraceae bacterium]|nr:GHKL domain-containing protein [Lachnospiraceae bacterium]